MTKEQLLTAAAVAVTLLGFRYYEQSRVWNAAYAHYVQPVVADDSRFQLLASGCESKSKSEDNDREGEWARSTIRLQQGMPNFDPFLEQYAYYIVMDKLSPLNSGGRPVFLEATCYYEFQFKFFFVSVPI